MVIGFAHIQFERHKPRFPSLVMFHIVKGLKSHKDIVSDDFPYLEGTLVF